MLPEQNKTQNSPELETQIKKQPVATASPAPKTNRYLLFLAQCTHVAMFLHTFLQKSTQNPQ